MDVIDLLNSDEAELPKLAETSRPYIDQLAATLRTYVDHASALTGADPVTQGILAARDVIRTLTDHLLGVHASVLSGRLDSARDEMAQAIATVRPQLETLTSVPLDRKGLGTLYRLRVEAPSESLGRQEMFHIPFDLRHVVKPQRYSTLGIPMLYLGSTIFISWEELGRPAMEDVWVSALRLRDGQALRVINFGFRPAVMAAMLATEGFANAQRVELTTAYAVLWPLIAACSFRRRFSSATFVEEYVIPQQLVGYLVESADFDGVRFFSNRVKSYKGATLTMNFALPARPDGGGRFSQRLVELFEMTPPMPYPMVLRLGAPLNTGDPYVGNRRGTLEAIPGHEVDYQRTEYSRVEGHLEVQDFEPLA